MNKAQETRAYIKKMFRIALPQIDEEYRKQAEEAFDFILDYMEESVKGEVYVFYECQKLYIAFNEKVSLEGLGIPDDTESKFKFYQTLVNLVNCEDGFKASMPTNSITINFLQNCVKISIVS